MDSQADLSIRKAYISKDTVSHVVTCLLFLHYHKQRVACDDINNQVNMKRMFGYVNYKIRQTGTFDDDQQL